METTLPDLNSLYITFWSKFIAAFLLWIWAMLPISVLFAIRSFRTFYTKGIVGDDKVLQLHEIDRMVQHLIIFLSIAGLLFIMFCQLIFGSQFSQELIYGFIAVILGMEARDFITWMISRKVKAEG